MPYHAIIHTAIAKLGLVLSHKGLVQLDFLPITTQLLPPADGLAKQVVTKLEAYFAKATSLLDIPLDLQVSPFQQQVLSYLSNIPQGQVRSYGQIAIAIASGARAVGNACRHNPVPIVIPCHRVVAASHLGGYSGAKTGTLLDIKRWLLAHEGWVG